LLNTFDKIWVLDLHGNSKKKEVCPDGSPDTNVFDIMQGVAIIIGVKKQGKAGAKKELAQMMHGDLWGTRKSKYEALWEVGPEKKRFNTISPYEPRYLFYPFDRESYGDYATFCYLTDLFSPNGRPAPGMVTTHDQFAVAFTERNILENVEKLLSTENETAARKLFKLCSTDQWNYEKSKIRLGHMTWRELVQKFTYRPFDERFTVYEPSVAVHLRDRMTRQFVAGSNIGLTVSRMTKGESYAHALVTRSFTEAIILSPKTSNNGFTFPLYLYPTEQDLDQTRRVNMDPKIRKQIEDLAAHPTHGRPDEVAIFDYIYGVLHCPAYRSTYAEFLKIDFPRVPWPTSPDAFWDISAKGGALRRLHLMEDAAIGPTPYKFNGDGDSVVDKPEYKNGHIWINKAQCFEDVPPVAWGFFIGGYQPAQKWLKDRKGRALSFEDIKHYQKIIKILTETDRIMATIEMAL
jgi:predicted helicase